MPNIRVYNILALAVVFPSACSRHWIANCHTVWSSRWIIDLSTVILFFGFVLWPTLIAPPPPDWSKSSRPPPPLGPPRELPRPVEGQCSTLNRDQHTGQGREKEGRKERKKERKQALLCSRVVALTSRFLLPGSSREVSLDLRRSLREASRTERQAASKVELQVISQRRRKAAEDKESISSLTIST